jgi:GGDEF domain-containing protein
MSDITPENLYLVFETRPTDKEPERRLLGKFVMDQDGITVLENHGMREDLESLSPEEASRYIHSLSRSMYTEVVCLQDVIEGHHPELLPVDQESPPDHLREQLTGAGDLGITFEYFRQGHGPQELTVEAGRTYLDGHPLSDAEVDRIQETIQTGLATLKHTQPLGKSEQQAPDLMSRHMLTDTLVPAAGNHHSWKQSLSQPGGVHVHINGNDTGQLNTDHGFKAGNEAVAALGNAIRQTLDEAVGRKKSQLYRIGGDNFSARVPNLEAAAGLSRHLRSKLKGIPALRGEHNLSVSIGFGNDSDQAESALQDAKADKNRHAAKPGQAKTHAASRLPGHEVLFPAD